MASCPACGRAAAQEARFCSACGAQVGADSPRIVQARKTVTILFADVSGFTSLGERLDPETLQEVMSRYFDEMRRVITRDGGRVGELVGGAVIGLVGGPGVPAGVRAAAGGTGLEDASGADALDVR